MPGNIYYLVASLPYLSHTDPPPITIEEFLFACSNHLPAGQVQKLGAILGGDYPLKGAGASVLKLWHDSDTTARGELARLRAERLERPVEPVGNVMDGRLASAVEAANGAFRATSPLAADDILESARWDYLDSLEFGRYFNFETVVLYMLKLKVLARREGLSLDRGRAGFESVLDGRKEEIGVLMEAGFVTPPSPKGRGKKIPPLKVRGG